LYSVPAPRIDSASAAGSVKSSGLTSMPLAGPVSGARPGWPVSVRTRRPAACSSFAMAAPE